MAKPCAYIGQELMTHLKNTLSISMKFVEENNWINIIYYRIKAVKTIPCLKCGKNDILNIIKLICILHDIGKAAKIYQDQFDDNCNAISNSVSFRCHEVPSAYIIYNLLKPIYGDTVAKLASLSTLLHIVRNENPLEYNLYTLKRYGVWDLTHYQEYLNDSLNITLDDNLTSIRYDEAYNHIQMLKEFAQKNPSISKLHILFLTPLIVGDNLDAFDRIDEGEKNLWRIIFVNQLREALGMDYD